MANTSSQDATTSPWLTPAAAAARLGIAIGTIRNWTSQRFIPFSKKGRIVRYHRDELDRWLAKGGCRGRTALNAKTSVVEQVSR